ncbi:MAG: alpha-amylase family glycosyl hydrolase, partial [Actinomycetes bacterium]
ADGPAERLSWLKRLVSACHDRGLHVIMDGVFNHVSPAFPYRFLYADPTDCPFTAEPFGGSFPGLQDLDFRHPMTGEFVLDVCRYWTQTFDLDGIRFDNTVNFLVPGDLRGLPELLTGLEEELVRTDRSHFSLTLEHLRLDAAAVTNATRATSFWDDSLFQAARTGLERGRIDGALLAALDNRRFLDQGKVQTLYLSNHDHSQLGWLAGAREQVGATGAWWRMQPYVIALLTATAVPLVPNGQEFGEEHWLPEDDHGTGRRVTGRPLRWKIAGDPIGQTLMALFRRLLHLRREHPALRSPLIYPEAWEPAWGELTDVGVGVAADRQLVVYHRWAELADAVENVVVVLNFGDAFQTVRTPFPLQGTWTDLLAGFDGMGPPWTLGVNGSTAEVPVGSHWGRVLHKTTARVP